MQTTEVDYDGALPIDSYGPGFFRVGGLIRPGNLLIRAEAAQHWGGFDDLDPLAALAGQIDVLFVGVGATLAHLPRAMRERLEPLGLMCEAMTTPSAARSYNVLLSEGRKVAAALIAMPEA